MFLFEPEMPDQEELSGTHPPQDASAVQLWSCVVSWSIRFPEPIGLPDGGKLATLQNAGAYITK
jgi:hypothetical protein